MGKRFTETTKWADTWFMDLEPSYKCAWFFMLDHCDNAGVWVVNPKLLSILVGADLSWNDIKAKFGEERLFEFSPGKVWIRKFIDYQFGDLSPTCKPHAKIITALKRYGLWTPYLAQLDRVLDRVPGTLQEEEEEEDKEKEEEKEEGSAEGRLPDTHKLPVRSEEAVAHAAARRIAAGPTQADYDRAGRVLALYPTRAKDGRAVRIDIAALNLLGSKIAESPAFPWEEAAELEGLNETPLDASRWASSQPDAMLLATRRKQRQDPPKPTEPPRKKAQAL